MPGIWFGAPLDLCGYRQMPRHAKHRRTTGNRQYPAGIVLERLLAVECMRGEPTTILAERPSRRRSVAARWRAARARVEEVQGFSGRKWSEARGGGVGREAEGRKPG